MSKSEFQHLNIRLPRETIDQFKYHWSEVTPRRTQAEFLQLLLDTYERTHTPRSQRRNS